MSPWIVSRRSMKACWLDAGTFAVQAFQLLAIKLLSVLLCEKRRCVLFEPRKWRSTSLSPQTRLDFGKTEILLSAVPVSPCPVNNHSISPPTSQWLSVEMTERINELRKPLHSSLPPCCHQGKLLCWLYVRPELTSYQEIEAWGVGSNTGEPCITKDRKKPKQFCFPSSGLWFLFGLFFRVFAGLLSFGFYFQIFPLIL